MAFIRKARTPDFSRRDILRYSAATASVLALCETTGMPVAHAEGAFTVATTAGSWGDGIKQAFVTKPDFEAANKTTVNFLLEANPAAIASRLVAQPGNPPASAFDLLDLQYALAADAGALMDYDLDIVKNYADIAPSAQFEPRAGLKNWGANMTMPIISLVWNTKLATKPASMEDLWNPKYKGKVGLPDFGWYGHTWMHALNKTLGGTEDNTDKAVAAIKDLVKKNEAVLLQNQEQALRAFTTEQIVIMPYWNGRTFELQSKGVPVDIEYVQGTIQLHNGFVLPKATAFKELANRFVNNTLDPVLQLEMTQRFRYPPSNTKAKLPPDLAPYAIPQGIAPKVVSLDWQKINEARTRDLQRWNKEIFG
ncbi:MAG: extracellular solute-binding protein [Alphaproteobacteria bacterium]|nr:extracellular solute-binding protein [Alphaproteobacteria bacterium]